MGSVRPWAPPWIFREGGGARKFAYKVTVRAISVAALSEELNVYCRSNIEVIGLNTTLDVGVLPRFLYVSNLCR